MQKNIFSLIVFMIGMILFVSCAKDTVVQPQTNIPPNLKISFADTIQPIFTSNCAGSNCHSGLNDGLQFIHFIGFGNTGFKNGKFMFRFHLPN